VGDRVRLISLSSVTLAVAILEASAALVALTVTAGGEGRIGGAVYTPSEEMTPRVALPPGMPETLQVTAVLGEFDTVAVKETALPSKTETFVGMTCTETGGVPDGGPGLGFETAPAHPARNAHSATIVPARAPDAVRACGFPEAMA
jgi:hypothetical protein